MSNPSKQRVTEKGKPSHPSGRIPGNFVWLYALITVVLIPAVYYKPAIDVTWVPKFVVLSGFMLVVMLFFLAKSSYRLPDFSLFRRSPVILWSAFVAVSLISILVAHHIPEALFDVYRNLLLLIFLLVTTSVLIQYNSIRPFVVMAIVLAWGFATIGLFQYFSHVFRQMDLEMLYKINGLMSHKNVFSSVLFLLMPFLSYAILTSRPKECIPAIIGLVSVLTLMFLMQTRGIWLATLVFFTISILLILLRKKTVFLPLKGCLGKSGLVLSGALVLGLLIAGGINHYSVNHPKKEALYRLQAAENANIQKIEPLTSRAKSIFNTSSPNRVKRIDIWRCSMKLIADHPVLGVGAGNWKVIIPAYYQPEPNEAYYHNWRRPHNDFIWVWSEKGVLGLLTYLGFFVALFLTGWRVLRSGNSPEDKLLTIMMMGGLGGYLVDASFAFPYERMDLQMMMMLLASIILWKNIHMKTGESAHKAVPNRRVSGVIVLVLCLLIWSGTRIIKAEKYTNYAHYAHTQNQWDLVITALDQAPTAFALLDPVNNPLQWYRGNALFRLQKLDEAAKVLEQARNSSPYSVPVLQDLATVYYLQKNYAEAISLLQESLTIYPLNRNALKIKGMAHFELGEYEEALTSYYRCLSVHEDPNLNLMIQDAQRKLHPESNQ